MVIHLDFETRSSADIKKVGAWVYSLHPSTDVICLAYGIDGDVYHWRPGQKPPKKLFDVHSSGHRILAYNAFFEYSIWMNVMAKKYGWLRPHFGQWFDVAAKAAAHALPRSLGEAGKALKLKQIKDESGKKIMLKLSKPRRDGSFYTPEQVPEDFKKLYEYNIDDVIAETAIDDTLRNLTETEKKVWELDFKINTRGIYIDRKAVLCAMNLINLYTERLNKRIKIVTCGAVEAATQRQRLLDWVVSKGVPAEALAKADVQELIKGDLPPDVREALEIRGELSRSSTAKYSSALEHLGEDDRIRGSLLYHGAAPGRWAGSGFQPHNLPRGTIKNMELAIDIVKENRLPYLEMMYDSVMETLSSAVRGVICAPPGKKLYCVDYAAIEARGILWLSGDPGIGTFQRGGDIYKEMASDIYSKEVSRIDKTERQLGKIAILGLGYGMGASKFVMTCAGYGIEISEEFADRVVKTYRKKYADVVKFWYAVENAAIEAVRTNKIVRMGKVAFLMSKGFLYCRLPSGRCIAYCRPTLETITTPWGEPKLQVAYEGVNPKTKKWEYMHTYGGKLAENISQGTARDIMAGAMLALEDKGYEIIMTVHDEIVVETPKDFGSLKEFQEIASRVPEWARGFPVGVEGWEGERYKK